MLAIFAGPLAFLGRHGAWILFGGVFLGILAPGLAALCRPLLAPSVVLILLATLLRVDWTAVRGHLGRPFLTAALVAWLLLVSPVLTWLVLLAAPLPASLEIGLVLMAAAPPILASASIAGLLDLDPALALVAGLIATLLAPVTLPVLALELLDLRLAVGSLELMGRLGLVVALAFTGALIVRRLAGPARLARATAPLDGIVVVLMLVFAVAIMDGVAATLAARPLVVALWLAAAFLANPLLQLLGAGAARLLGLGLRQALTVGILTGNCNMGIVLAALPADSDRDVLLFFALAQLPMFMLPALALPLYRRLLAHLGPAKQSP